MHILSFKESMNNNFWKILYIFSNFTTVYLLVRFLVYGNVKSKNILKEILSFFLVSRKFIKLPDSTYIKSMFSFITIHSGK